MSLEKKYTLLVEWFDPNSSVIKQFYFSYYLPQKHIEMVLFNPYSTNVKVEKCSSKKLVTLP